MAKFRKVLLDWKDFSDEALKQLKVALRDFGLHIGDIEYERYGQAGSDTYVLYISKRKMTMSELEKYDE